MERNIAPDNLRRQFQEEARETVRGLEANDEILACILTGSAAWGTPNPDGDIDILLISTGRPGVVYRYLVPKFCPVKRRTELGFIPYDTVLRAVKRGYATTLSCAMIEQLKNGLVLFQRGTHGDDLIQLCRNAAPARVTVGALIDGAVRAAREAAGAARVVQFEDAALAARRATQQAVRVLLLARERVGVSKEKHELRFVRKRLSGREAAAYVRGMGAADVTPEEARRALEGSIALVRRVLERFGLSPELVKYDGT